MQRPARSKGETLKPGIRQQLLREQRFIRRSRAQYILSLVVGERFSTAKVKKPDVKGRAHQAFSIPQTSPRPPMYAGLPANVHQTAAKRTTDRFNVRRTAGPPTPQSIGPPNIPTHRKPLHRRPPVRVTSPPPNILRTVDPSLPVIHRTAKSPNKPLRKHRGPPVRVTFSPASQRCPVCRAAYPLMTLAPLVASRS